jgi:hypothetical protein
MAGGVFAMFRPAQSMVAQGRVIAYEYAPSAHSPAVVEFQTLSPAAQFARSNMDGWVYANGASWPGTSGAMFLV